MTDIEKCRICGEAMDTGNPLRSNCGGDCLLCMADAGDPDCIETAYSHMRKLQRRHVRHFINLTNGLQAIEEYGLDPSDVRFIRIQSTWCEQKRWEDILMALSDDFLMQAALGHECVVYDYGAGKPVPRAVWQGLEWVKFVLWRRWHSVSYVPEGRAARAWGYFDKVYYCLSDRPKARVDYFRKFVAGPLRIRAVTSATELDGETGEYARMARSSTTGPADFGRRRTSKFSGARREERSGKEKIHRRNAKELG